MAERLLAAITLVLGPTPPSKFRPRRWATRSHSVQRLLEAARELRRGGRLTVAVEEEFALLDPETLDLVNRFEDVHDAAQGTPLEPHLVGELIASEVEIRTGRCEPSATGRVVERREQLQALVEPLGLGSGRREPIPGPIGKTNGSSTPRTTAATTRSSGTSSGATTPSGSTSTSASAEPTGPSPSHRPPRFLPELLALSASSPFSRASNTGLHSARTQIFTRSSRAAACPTPSGLGGVRALRRFLYETRSMTSTPSSGGASARICPSPRSRSGSATASPTSARRSRSPPSARAHGADRARGRRGRAAGGPAAPLDRGEPLARDPLRALRRADRPARQYGPRGRGSRS